MAVLFHQRHGQAKLHQLVTPVHAAGLVIGRNADMRAHCRRRIQQAEPVLNGQPVQRVGVVAGPVLGHIVQHSGVKPRPAAGTALDEQLRVGFGHAVQQVFVAAFQRSVAGDVQRPVRMQAVQFAVPAHRLRLEPQPEFHPLVVDDLRRPDNAARQLAFVAHPVPHGGAAGVVRPEPAVVQHEQLHARLPGQLRLLLDFGKAHIIVHGFPGIEQNRPFQRRKPPGHQVVPVQRVELPAHAVQARAAVGEVGLPCVGAVEGQQLPRPGRQLQRGALHVFQHQHLAAEVLHPLMAGHHAEVFKHRVIQHHPQADDPVLADDFQRFGRGVARKGGVQPLQRGLALQNTPALEQGFRRADAVLPSDGQGRDAEIAAPADRVFKGEIVRGRMGDRAVQFSGVGALVVHRLAAAAVSAQRGAKVVVDKLFAVHHRQHIADGAAVQMGHRVGELDGNAHNVSSILWVKPMNQVSAKATAKATRLQRMYRGSCSLR